MAESSEEAPRNENLATFAWLRRPTPDRVGLRVGYRGAQIVLDWPKGADADDNLDGLIAYLPKILVAARKEREVTEFVLGMDAEIQQLLGGDE